MVRVNGKQTFKWKQGSFDCGKYAEDAIPKTYDKSNINKLKKKLRKSISNSAKNINNGKVIKYVRGLEYLGGQQKFE